MLTIKQKMVLEAIEYYINKYGYSPTIREIAELVETSPACVFEKLLILEEKGIIETSNNKARTIVVLKSLDEVESEEC